MTRPRFLLLGALLLGVSSPTLAHGLYCQCQALDEGQVRCNGGLSDGTALPGATLDKLLEVKNDEWTLELDGVKAFFMKFGSHMPVEMWRQFEGLKERLMGKVAA